MNERSGKCIRYVYMVDSRCERTKISTEESCCKIFKTSMEKSLGKITKSI